MSQLSAAEIAAMIGNMPPTPEQRAVIEAPLEPAVVVAGAGAGKTATMAMRVLWLVANGHVAPGEILGLTFTNKAAGELEERVHSLLSKLYASEAGAALRPDDSLPGLDRPEVSTYNAYAASLVRDYGVFVGAEPDAGLLDEASRFQLASQVLDEATAESMEEIDGSRATIVDRLLRLADACSEHLVPAQRLTAFLRGVLAHLDTLPSKVLASGKPTGEGPTNDKGRAARAALAAKAAYGPLVEAFAEAKRRHGMMDFGDQVALAARIAREVPEVDAERRRWKVVLLDEYQDTSYSQVVLLEALFGRGHAVTAVGDPRQSIYGWRGASEGNMTEFAERFLRGDGRTAAAYELSVGFRNDHAILAAANDLADELLREPGDGPSPALRSRPDAAAGQVDARVFDTETEELEALAAWAASRVEAGSTAVLCRTRDQMMAVERHLTAAGVTVHVLGTDGLLAEPGVADLVATLHVIDDPDSGEHLMRLLTSRRFNLGASDIAALHAYARMLSAKAAGDEEVGLVEAVDEARTVPGLSDDGHARVRELARLLAGLRERAREGIAELARATESALGLDIEAEAAPRVRLDTARGNLDAFHRVANEFAASTEGDGSLTAFLAWLEVAEVEERGLARMGAEPDDAAVAILTVHAAKGLEWDAVAVPGLREGGFPSQARGVAAWFDAAQFPHPLRGDRRHLVEVDYEGQESWFAFQKHLDSEVAAGVREKHRDAERKLAYVAMTRARQHLWLSHAWYRPGKKQSNAPSEFLATAARSQGMELPAEGPAENPRPEDGTSVAWPIPEDPGSVRGRAAALVASLLAEGGSPHAASSPEGAARPDALDTSVAETGAMASGVTETGVPPIVPSRTVASGADARPGHTRAGEARATTTRRLQDESALLERWAERLLAEESPAPREAALPSRMSPTRIVAYRENEAAFLRDLARPVPREPVLAMRIGTAFHTWVQNRYGQATIEGWEDADVSAVPTGVMDRLKETFEASRFAPLRPLEVELPFELTIGAKVIPGKIDAVFAHADGVEVVDWKTGRKPPEDELGAKSLQLAIYRLAYAEMRGIDPETVRATFFYLGDDEEYVPPSLPGRAELEEIVGER